MDWKIVGAAALLVVAGVPGVAFGQPGSIEQPAVVVRSYDNFGVPSEDLGEARILAESIFLAAGIELTWIDCWYRDHEPVEVASRCRQPIAAFELVLRFQAGPSGEPRAKFVSMGFSLVGSGPTPSFLSTVFVDLVQTVARGAAVDPRQVMGLAIAHEIGHLLLNSNRHPSSGLMRAAWSVSELRRNAPSDGRFLDSEATIMRTAIAARTAEK